MTALEDLGNQIAASRPPQGELRELLERHLIDTVGAWIASSRTAEGKALLAFRSRMRERGQTGCPLDLATHCGLARLSEVDDIHLPSMTTPGSIVIPGALVIAAAEPGSSSDDVTAAMLAGYEVMTRLGRAIDGPGVLYRGLWPTYFAAPFAIAAVAARLHRLSPAATADALAHALTYAAPGVGHGPDATARWFAVGNAARNGLTAALVAQQGHGADRGLLDGQFLSSIYQLMPDLAALTGALGEGSVLPEVSFKPWCAARQTMAATQALKEIIAEGVAPAAISEIKAYVLPPHRKMIDHGITAHHRISHITSLPYAMAVAALAPERALTLDPAQGAPSPAIEAFMAKIKVEADDALLADYPRTWPARVSVTAAGRRHERHVTQVPGDPARAFDRAQVQEKFLQLVRPVLGPQPAEQLRARCSAAMASGQFAALMVEIERATEERL